MPAHIWDGSTFKKIKQRAYWTGSEWKSIKSSHIWTGTEWKRAYLASLFVVGTSTAKTTPGTSLTIPVPDNTMKDDLILAFVAPRGNSSDIAAPSGWTKIVSQDFSASRFFVFSRVAGASEPASYTLTFATSGVLLACAVTLRAGRNDMPVNAQSGSSSTFSGTAITTPSVTTTIDGALVFRVAWGVNSNGSAASVAWSSADTLVQVAGASGSSASVLSLSSAIQSPLGATGAVNATLDPTGARLWLTLAISPA